MAMGGAVRNECEDQAMVEFRHWQCQLIVL